MKKKILYTASTEIHLKSFHLPYLKWFKDQGFEIHVVYNGNNKIAFSDFNWNIPFARSPLDRSNWKAYKELKKIIDDNNYDLIHCHTPMASIVTRLASITSRKKGTKVLYTAHGFHFYKTSPLKNWLFFYPIEKFMSKFTDAIITINREDFDILHKKSFSSKGKHHIYGIGIDPSRLNIINEDNLKLRKELSFSEEDFVVLYIAEFIDRKNHRFVVDSIYPLISNNKNIKFLFAGGGILKEQMETLAKENDVIDNIEFLGFRKDIGKYISISDVGISSSKQEGLGLGVAELMFNGKPVVITQDRGHRELVVHGENGFIFEQGDKEKFIEYIELLYKDKNLQFRIGKKAKESMDKFKIENSLKEMINIYKQYL